MFDGHCRSVYYHRAHNWFYSFVRVECHPHKVQVHLWPSFLPVGIFLGTECMVHLLSPVDNTTNCCGFSDFSLPLRAGIGVGHVISPGLNFWLLTLVQTVNLHLLVRVEPFSDTASRVEKYMRWRYIMSPNKGHSIHGVIPLPGWLSTITREVGLHPHYKEKNLPFLVFSSASFCLGRSQRLWSKPGPWN